MLILLRYEPILALLFFCIVISVKWRDNNIRNAIQGKWHRFVFAKLLFGAKIYYCKVKSCMFVLKICLCRKVKRRKKSMIPPLMGNL